MNLNKLFDLPIDSTLSVPPDLLKLWQNSDLSIQTHEMLLAPYKKNGTLVCSDSAGLTKISQKFDLFEVLKLISEPKEILHSYLSGLGSIPVGYWFADNTCSFLKAGNTEGLTEALIMARAEIKNKKIQLGICVHSGEFINFGQSICGENFDLCLELAENHTAGGEILLSESYLKQSDTSYQVEKREDLFFKNSFYRLISETPKHIPTKSIDSLYPLPFDSEFYQNLKQNARQLLQKRLVKNHFVALLSIRQNLAPLLLDRFLLSVRNNLVIAEIAQTFQVRKIKSNGQIAIFTSSEMGNLFNFCDHLIRELSASGLQSTAAIAKGEILLFRLNDLTEEIAGSPVNIVSKLAEDSELSNVILVHESAFDSSISNRNFTDFNLQIGGVSLLGQVYEQS